VSKDKGYFVFGTKVCHPIPTKDAFDTDNDVIDIWKNQFKEQLRVRFDILVNIGIIAYISHMGN